MKPLEFPYLKLGFDRATGQLQRQAARLAGMIDWGSWHPGRPTVLCLERAQFRKDIEELRTRTPYNWVTLGATRPKHIQEPWVAEKYRIQTYFTHDLDTRAQHLKAGLAEFGTAFLHAATAMHPVDALMAGNTDYWQDDALKLGCRKIGIPFLVLGRENYTKKIDADKLKHRFQDAKLRFSGTGVAVLSAATREVMVGSGSFPDADVWVTGAPRFDRWLDVGPAPGHERIYMTFLSYADPVYLAQANFAECLKIFAEAAKVHAGSGLKFIVKVKKPSEVEPVQAAMPNIRDYPVEVVWDAALYDLYPRSRIIIGYNTLAAAEGFFTDAPVVLPTWGDALRNSSETLIHYDNPVDAAAAYFPRSAAELRNLIEEGAAGKLRTKGTRETRMQSFRRHIAVPESGTCSDAVARFVAHYLEKRRAGGSSGDSV
jgi:hypothetical protein